MAAVMVMMIYLTIGTGRVYKRKGGDGADVCMVMKLY